MIDLKRALIQWKIENIFLNLLILCVIVTAEYIQTSLTIQDILPENPKHYDKMRPPKKEGSPTTVFFHVTVMGLDSIDENAMTYAADIFFAQTWKDHRLRLPENMTSEYRLLEVEWLKNMWRPDSFFKNAKAVTFQTMTIPNHYVWLYKDKTILYMVKLTLTLSCAMNFMIYPHDTQECKLQMESLSHTTEDMIFQWDPDVPLVVDENIELPQLQLIKNYTADCTQVYSTGNFTCLEVVFVLKRRLGYYLFHTYIPTCLIVIMSWVSFWIKPEAAPARVTLGVTSLLTLSTQHAKSQAALPPVSYLKAVDGFMSVCTVFVFMALMEYCLVNIVLGDNEGPKSSTDQPKMDKIFDLAAKENARLITGQPSQPPRPNPAARNRARAINIDRFSRVFFPLLFAVLNATYWIMFYQFMPTARCLKNGQFDPLQCISNTCYCVSKETGEWDKTIPIVSPIFFIRVDNPSCFDSSIHKPGEYFTECELERNALLEEKLSAQANGFNVLYSQKVNCKPDGNYADLKL